MRCFNSFKNSNAYSIFIKINYLIISFNYFHKVIPPNNKFTYTIEFIFT